MPQIKPEPQQIILQKLSKLKCCTNCQNIANYLIFGEGLYCTQCLSQFKNLTPQQFINYSNLSSILVQLIGEYQKKTKGQLSYLKVAKTQTDKWKSELKKLKDGLNFQIKSVKNKYSQIINDRYKRCLKQHTLEQLQALYQPDMTATTVMNEKEILLRNLDILKVKQNDGKVEYHFEDTSKHPQQIFKKSLEDYTELKTTLINSTEQVKAILQKFRLEIKNN